MEQLIEIKTKKLDRLSRDQIVVSIITRAMKEMEFAFKEHKIAHGGIEILAKVKDGIWTISYGRQLHKQAANISENNHGSKSSSFDWSLDSRPRTKNNRKRTIAL